MNRSDHLQFAKDRAIVICKDGDITGGLTSMISDLESHEELRDHLAIKLCMTMMLGGHLKTESQAIEFINGFN